MKKLVKNLDEPKEEPKKTEEKAKPKEETKVEKVPSDKTTVAGFTRPLVDTEAVEGQIRAELAAQLSGPPYQNQEVAAGGHIVLHTSSVFGPVGAGVIALPQSFYNQYPTFSKQIYQDFVNTIAWVTSHLDQAAQYLAANPASAGNGTVAQFKALLEDPSIVYDKTPSGLIAYATFMQSIGLISKAPASVNDLELPTVRGTGS